MRCVRDTDRVERPDDLAQQRDRRRPSAGALDGLTLMATMSPGDTNRAHASVAARSPVSDAMPCVSIVRTAGCGDLAVDDRARSGRPRRRCPGNRPGMASGGERKSGACSAIFSESARRGLPPGQPGEAEISVPSATL